MKKVQDMDDPINRIMQEVFRALEKEVDLARRTAPADAHMEGIYQALALAVGCGLIGLGLAGKEGSHFMIDGGSRADMVNQTLAANNIGYRLTPLQ